MKKEELKFCVNCKHYSYDQVGIHHLCSHPKNLMVEINLVTGLESELHIETPEILRQDTSLCGPVGEWFERL